MFELKGARSIEEIFTVELYTDHVDWYCKEGEDLDNAIVTTHVSTFVQDAWRLFDYACRSQGIDPADAVPVERSDDSGPEGRWEYIFNVLEGELTTGTLFSITTDPDEPHA